MNLELRWLQENMVELINSVNLPIEAKRLVVCEILHKLEVEAEKIIYNEMQEKKKEENAKVE